MVDLYATELWKEVPGYEGYYAVSDMGRVADMLREMALLRQYAYDGYPHVYLSTPARPFAVPKVHTLVLTAFVGPRPGGMGCCHYDGDKTNNRLENLRWDTPKSNARDTARHGRHVGKPINFLALTEADRLLRESYGPYFVARRLRLPESRVVRLARDIWDASAPVPACGGAPDSPKPEQPKPVRAPRPPHPDFTRPPL